MTFTAKDVQALRQATGAGMMDAKRALEATDGDMEAAKQWLREKGLGDVGQAPGARERPGRGVAVRRRRLRRHGQAHQRDRLRRLVGDASASWPATSPPSWPTAARTRSSQRGQGDRRPQDHPEGEHPARRGRAVRGRRRATCSTRTSTSRAAGASTACWSSWPAATPSSPTTWPCTSPSPARPTSRRRTCPPTSSPRSGPRSRPSPATRASPSRPSRRSSRAASRASTRTVCLLEQPFAKDDKKQVKDLLGGAVIVRWAQAEIG